MEMRTLARCLRARPMGMGMAMPTPSPRPMAQVYMKPSIQAQSIRYSTNASYDPLRPTSKQTRDEPSSPSEPAVPSEQQTESRPSARQSEFDRIIGNLSLNNASQQQQQQQQQQQESPYYPTDPASDAGAGAGADAPNTLTRSVADSAATENSRVVPRVELKLGPSLGRQVHVEPDRGFDLAAALRTMNAACSQNKIMQQQRKQKFHIRRGQMRKNLRMERWRKLFKFSFDHTVSKIQRMRAQGW